MKNQLIVFVLSAALFSSAFAADSNNVLTEASAAAHLKDLHGMHKSSGKVMAQYGWTINPSNPNATYNPQVPSGYTIVTVQNNGGENIQVTDGNGNYYNACYNVAPSSACSITFWQNATVNVGYFVYASNNQTTNGTIDIEHYQG
jgi:hypothetical protein